MTVLQTLSSFPTDYSGVMLSLQVSSSARHGTAMGSSGAFRASQTRESAGWRPLWDDVQGGDRGLLHHPRCHLLLISPPNCLVLLSRYLLAHHQGWGDNVFKETLEHLIPAALCPRTLPPSRQRRVGRSPDKLDSTSLWYKIGPSLSGNMIHLLF